MALSDEDLLTQIASGGREAYAALYQRYSPRVYGLLLTLLRDRTDAEDVLQEVMWEVWRKADRYDPATGSPPTWILMIARSRAVDALRRGGRFRKALNVAASQRDPNQHAEAPALRDIEPDHLDRILIGLPAEQQTAIRLAFTHGLTRQQIADTTGVPIGTVKTRISLGVRRLADALDSAAKGVAS